MPHTIKEKDLLLGDYVIAEYRDGYYCIVKISVEGVVEGVCRGQGIRFANAGTNHDPSPHFIEANNVYAGRSFISRFATSQEAEHLEQCIKANAYVDYTPTPVTKKHRKATAEQLEKAKNILSKYLDDEE
jgi:hypothetical protein